MWIEQVRGLQLIMYISRNSIWLSGQHVNIDISLEDNGNLVCSQEFHVRPEGRDGIRSRTPTCSEAALHQVAATAVSGVGKRCGARNAH